MKLFCTLNKEHQITVNSAHGVSQLEDRELSYQLKKLDQNNYQIIKDNKSYTIIIVSFDGKNVLLNVNGYPIEVKIQDQLDMMITASGSVMASTDTINEILAPMPGTILEVLVSTGQEVKKGDALLILNAMKMENVIKSPSDAEVLQVNVVKNQNVNKNEVLISLK